MSRDGDALVRIVREITDAGGHAEFATADVGDLRDVQRAATKAVERFGRIDTYCISEVLTLAAQSLSCISGEFVLDVSHLGIVSAVLDSLGVSPAARDNLLGAATKLQQKNQQNEILLRQAIELTEFDITLFKSIRQAPETANYNKNAYNTGALLGSSGFDAKQ